jgi:cytochrome P450
MTRLNAFDRRQDLFDADVEGDAGEGGWALAEIMELFGYLTFPSRSDGEVPVPAARPRFNRARARLDAVIYRIIDERRREGAGPGRSALMLLLAER